MASAQDILFFGVIVLIFGTGFLTMHYMVGQVVDNMLQVPVINNTAGARTSVQSMNNMANRLDYVTFGLMIGLILAMIIGGWFVAGHPMFMFVYFIVIIIGVTISTLIANFWEAYSGMAIFGTSVEAFPITNHVLSYLPFYVAIIGFIGMIVMFAKPYGGPNA